MAISRILGASLVSDLDRQGVDLQFTTSGNALVYMDFVDFRLGVNEANPSEALHVNGNLLIANGNLLTSGNLTYDIGSPTNWFRSVYADNVAAGSFTSNTLVGTLLTNAQPNITSVGTLTGLSVDGNISADNISGTLLTADQPNITSIGNLNSLTVTGQIVSTVDDAAPLIINSNVQVANLYATRASYSDQIEVTTSDSATTYYLTGVNASTTGVYSLTSTPQLSFDANTDILTAAGFIGTLQTNAQPNITSLGTLTELTVAGNVNVTLGNLQPSANLTSSLGYTNKWWNALYVNNVTANGYYGTILTGDQPNITNLANVYIDNVTIGSTINLPGNISLETLNADEIYEDGNRVVTEVSTIIIVGDDVSGSGNISNVFVELSDTGVTAGVYGSADDEYADRIPKITVDSKGRITNIANVTLTQVGNVSFNDTTISSNTEITVSAVGNIYLDAQGEGVVYITGSDAVRLPYGDIADRPLNPEPGYFRFNAETQNIEVFNGNIWTGPDSAVISSETITPDGISNTFTIAAVGAVTDGVLVSINGTMQQPYTSYTIVNDEIIFTEVPADTDIIEIRSLSTGAVVSASQLRGINANVILTSGTVNVSGNLIPSADVTYNIGSEDKQWKDLYLSGNTIYLGGATLRTNGSALEFTPVGSETAIDLSGDTDPTSISSGTSNVRVTSSYVNVAINNSNVVSISGGGIVTTGNIAAEYIIGNGSQLTGLPAGYTDANVAEYLPTYTGNIASLTTANTNMKGYVDAINSTLTANAGAQAGTLATIQSTYAQLSGAGFTGALSAPSLSLATALPVTSGGTGATTSATALDNLLPSGEQTGYVLKTSGPGTYYWSGETGGGGVTVGQQLTTVRQSNVATAGQTVFDFEEGIAYTPGTGQLRVYIDGVRQHPDAYTETSNVSYTLSSGVSAGTNVFAEIDQFSTFDNFANLVYASNVGNIQAAGLTVQAAIESLENNKAPQSNPVFTGNVSAANFAGNVTATNITATNITGTLLTASQPNITGVGTITSGTWSAGTIDISRGGTGATTTSGVGGALDNLLPSGEQTGYVLATTGAGSYFWTSPSTGGTTVGQQLTTQRQSNAIVSNTTVINLSGISYTPGAGQLRVYVNGVRQFPAAYTETSNVSYTLSANVVSGDTVFTEIDQFSSFNNFANLTFASNIGNIAAVGLTVQSAINSLETTKAPLASPVFTGTVSGITASMVGLGSVTNESKATMFTSPTFTGTATATNLTINGLTTLAETTETLDTKSSVTGTVVHDFSTTAIWYYSSISGNVTANFTNVPTTNNRITSVSIVVNQGGTGYIVNGLQIDGVTQTIRWQANTVPSASTNQVDVFTFSLLRAADAWTVLGSATSHG